MEKDGFRTAMRKASKVLEQEWGEYFKDKPEPKNQKEAEKQIRDFSKWLNSKEPSESIKSEGKACEVVLDSMNMPFSKLQKHKNRVEELHLEPVGEHEWMLEFFPGENIDEQFDEALDHMDAGRDKEAEVTLSKIVTNCPTHIDAMHHLAILLDNRGEQEGAKELWKSAVDIGKNCFPADFKPGEDKLEWGWLENRPFLRAYYGLGLVVLREEKFQDALNIFTDIIKLNPNDNQGARALVIECYLALKNPEGVLSVRKQYEDDCMVDTVYGEVLALFQLNRLAEAKEALKEAIKYSPLVAKELIKLKHPPVEPSSSYGVAVGGPDEAYEYWESCGRFWEETEGAIEFIGENM